MKSLAIFASGSGTNAEQIIRHFHSGNAARIRLVLSNRSDAYVLERATQLEVPVLTFSRSKFYQTEEITQALLSLDIDLIILAGFLWLIPDHLLHKFKDRIINIHPALLPDFGGKGMYGHHVHEAVLASRQTESGITIHTIDEEYDRGRILFQSKCPVLPDDTPDTLASRIHKLEHEHYPRVIEEYLGQLRG